MKNQFTVSINQPLRFGKDDLARSIPLEAGLITGGAVRAVQLFGRLQ